MTDALVKLKDPVPDFKYFAEDQILTAGDLNRVVDFLDRQDRMTRSYTLGIGVVCGLEPGLQAFNRISVTRGAAVTSDGDLLVIDQDTLYTHFADFKDADAKYPQFRKANGQIIPMWELSTEAGPGRSSLTQFESAGNPDISSLVAMLYLESFIEPEEECEGQDCDKRGDRQVRNLKVMLVKQSDVAATVQALAKAAIALPRLATSRVNLGNNRITSYKGANGLAQRYSLAINATRQKAVGAFQKLLGSSFRPMLENVVDGNANWANLLNQARFRPNNSSSRIQYVYGFFADLVDAWNEWRECACQLPADCLPDPDLFPKHVVLGELGANVATADRTRHYFRPSALLQRGDEALARCHFLLRRIDVLIRSFRANRITQLRITPSKSRCQPLSARAIPYYYFDLANTPNPRTAWSFAAKQLSATEDIFSYHANDDGDASDLAKQPFTFGSLNYDFLRIEGHLDRDVDDVEQELEKLRKQHNLPFQILSVQVDDVIDKVRLPGKLRFPDLDAIFRMKKIDVLNSVRAAHDFGAFARTKVDEVADHEQKAEARTHIDSFNLEMTKTIEALPRTLKDFNPVNANRFKASLEKSFRSAEHFERVSTDIFRPTKASPIQKFLQAKRFRDYGLLLELYDKRKKKVQERSIFANFCTEQPGIEHQAGVPVGGTFVLIYEADSRQVLADFCLPYFSYFDMSTLEPEELEEPVEPPPQPVPLPRPPIVLKPPFVFSPDPWININKFKIDTLRGDAISKALTKNRDDIQLDFDRKLGQANVNFTQEMTDRVGKARTDLQVDLSQRFAQSQREIQNAFDVRVEDTKKIFQTEVQTKIDTFNWRNDSGKTKLDVNDLLDGRNVAVDPALFKIIEDINATRSAQNKLQTKRALGGELTLEETAALKEADNRLTNLVIEATKQPELMAAAPDAAAKAVVDQIKSVSLGIENKSNRRKLMTRFNALQPNSFTGRELVRLKPVLVRD